MDLDVFLFVVFVEIKKYVIILMVYVFMGVMMGCMEKNVKEVNNLGKCKK